MIARDRAARCRRERCVLPSRRKRCHRARTYNELLAGSDKDQYVEVPYEAPWSKGVYHLYVIRTADRDRLQALLLEVGVGTGIHYPIPLHLQKAYEGLGYREGDFPIAENAAREILSLPMYPQLELDQQKRVVQEVVKSLAGEAAGSRNPSLVTCESDSRAD